MGRKLTYDLNKVLDGLVALGRDPLTSREVSAACLKSVQLVQEATHAAQLRTEKDSKPIATMRLKRLPANPDLQRIASLERLIAQYEPVAVEQSALGFPKIREKVTAWQAELATLTTHKEQA